MSRRAKLICIIGTDGAGKTTQAEQLKNELESRGVRVRYTWGKFGSKYTRVIINFIKWILSSSGKDMSDHSSRSKTKDSFLSNRFVRTTYLLYMLIIYHFQILYRVVLPSFTNQVIICDRYVYDTVVDIMVDYDYNEKQGRRLLRLLFFVLPRPDQVIYIDIPPEVSLDRKNDIPTDRYIIDKKQAYTELLRDIDVRAVDGTQSKSTVSEKICEMYDYEYN